MIVLKELDGKTAAELLRGRRMPKLGEDVGDGWRCRVYAVPQKRARGKGVVTRGQWITRVAHTNGAIRGKVIEALEMAMAWVRGYNNDVGCFSHKGWEIVVTFEGF